MINSFSQESGYWSILLSSKASFQQRMKVSFSFIAIAFLAILHSKNLSVASPLPENAIQARNNVNAGNIESIFSEQVNVKSIH